MLRKPGTIIGLFNIALFVVGCQMAEPVAERSTVAPTQTAVFTETPSVEPLSTSTAPPTNTAVPVHTVSPTEESIPTTTPTSDYSPVQLPEAVPTQGIWTTIGTAVPAAEVITVENAADLVEVARWGKGSVLDVAYSPDGSKMYVLTAQGVYVYEAESARQLEFRPYHHPAQTMALAPDGQLLAVALAHEPNYIELRNPVRNELVDSFFFETRVLEMAFDKSGQVLFLLQISPETRDLELIAWDIASKTMLANLADVRDFTYAPDVNLLATNEYDRYGDEEKRVHLWRWEEGGFTAVTSFAVPESMPSGSYALALSSDGAYFALGRGSEDSQIAIWRLADEKLLTILNNEKENEQGKLSFVPLLTTIVGDAVSSLRFSPDNQHLMMTTIYGHVAVYQVADGALLYELDDVGTFAEFSPNGQVFASWEHTLSQWQVADGQYVNGVTQHIGNVRDLAIIPERAQLAIAAADGFIYRRNMIDGSFVSSMATYASAIDVTADGETMVSGGQFFVWDLNQNQAELLPSTEAYITNDIIISADGKIVIARDNTQIAKWVLEEDRWTFERLFGLYASANSKMAFSPNDNLAALTIFEEGASLLWHPELGLKELPPVPPELEDIIGSLAGVYAFSPDGRLLAGGTDEGFILFWTIDGYEATFSHVIDAGIDALEDLVFSPDQSLLATRSCHQVTLLDLNETAVVHTIDPLLSGCDVLFSEDGRYLILSHWDGSVRLWAVLVP